MSLDAADVLVQAPDLENNALEQWFLALLSSGAHFTKGISRRDSICAEDKGRGALGEGSGTRSPWFSLIGTLQRVPREPQRRA